MFLIAVVLSIFPLPEYRENLGARRKGMARVTFGGLDHGLLPSSQKGVRGVFFSQRRGHRGLLTGAKILGLAGAVLQGRIIRFHPAGKPEIGQGVFMGAVNPCLAWQRGKAFQGNRHLLQGTLENPSTAGTK